MTNAMPVFVGSALSNRWNASMPPAEAPTATTGKCAEVSSMPGATSNTAIDADEGGPLVSGLRFLDAFGLGAADFLDLAGMRFK